jgi:hypothetical protein
VQVYVPWYVALLDTARGLVPQSRPARVLAGAMAMSVLAAVTVATLWLVTQVDAVVFAVDLGVERMRAATGAWVTETLAGTFGDASLTALRAAGWLGVLGVLLAMLVVTAGAATLLRGLARSRGR